jgi:PadR family transcriptional regulator AphA
MTKPPKLKSSSYVVLALVELLQPATVYDLKRLAHSSVFNFWALPHTVLYTESDRLAEVGLLVSEQEEGGRRRRRYTLSEAGLQVLEQWRAAPSDQFREVRDPGLLRLFGGTEERGLAIAQLALHREKLDEYEQLHDQLASHERFTAGMRLTLEAGIGIEREYVRFWSAVAADGAKATPADQVRRLGNHG